MSSDIVDKARALDSAQASYQKGYEKGKAESAARIEALQAQLANDQDESLWRFWNNKARELADKNTALQAGLAKAREALEKAAELAQEKSEELVHRWASDLGATVETQAAGAAAHIVSGLAGDILGLLAKAERSALQQKEGKA